MRYRTLGRTGLRVSEIGLGGGGLRCPTTEYAVRMVLRALDLGLNYIDTAPGYGDSEIKLGIALEGRRNDAVVATKVQAVTASDAKKSIDASLRRLRTDYLDVIQLHNVVDLEDLEVRTAPGSAWEAMLRALRAGKVRFVGITSHRQDVLVEALHRCNPDTVLFILNIVERNASEELIPLAQQRGVGMVVMKPLGMGMLPPKLALRFVLSQPVSCAVPGPSRLDWLEANLAVSDLEMPLIEDEVAEIERLRSVLDLARCRLCYVCEPCPLDIRIAYSLGTYRFFNETRNMGRDAMLAYPWGDWSRRHFPQELAEVIAGIERCDACGVCESRCPYGLPIVGLLKGMTPTLREAEGVVSSW